MADQTGVEVELSPEVVTMVTHVSAAPRVAAHRLTPRHSAVEVRRHRAADTPVMLSHALALFTIVLVALMSLVGLVVVGL